MADDRAQARAEVNERLLDETARRIHEVLQHSHGIMASPTLEEVRGGLKFSLEALAARPEESQTYGFVSLERSPVSDSQYYIRLHLGQMTYFPTKEQADG